MFLTNGFFYFMVYADIFHARMINVFICYLPFPECIDAARLKVEKSIVVDYVEKISSKISTWLLKKLTASDVFMDFVPWETWVEL